MRRLVAYICRSCPSVRPSVRLSATFFEFFKKHFWMFFFEIFKKGIHECLLSTFSFWNFQKKNFWVSFINILNLFKKIFKNPIFEHFKILMKNLMKKISWVSFKIFLEIFKKKRKGFLNIVLKLFFEFRNFQ